MKLKHDKLLSNVALNCNLRHYTMRVKLPTPYEGPLQGEVGRSGLNSG